MKALQSWFARVIAWLLSGHDSSLARRINDIIDASVLELGEGLTTGEISNKLEAKRRLHVETAHDITRKANKKATNARNRRDGLVNGLNKWVEKVEAEAEEMHEDANIEAAKAEKLAEMQRILRSGQ